MQWKKVKVKSLSRVRLFATPWTVAYQASPSMGCSRQEYWCGLPFPSLGDIPNPGIEPQSPAFQADALTSESSGKPSTWMQSQKQQNDLCSFPRQTIQYHSNPSLFLNQYCWRSWSWMVLGRPTRPFRTNTQRGCPFYYRGLECKSRKSRNIWGNRQIWPWNTEWSRAKANRVLPREHTHSKHPLPTMQ